MKIIDRAIFTATILALASGSALAAPALTLSNVNMRAGPSMDQAIVATIPGGSNVEVGTCSEGWCGVRWGRHAGYVNQSYLDLGGPSPAPRASAPPPPQPGPYGPPPPVAYGPPVYGPPPPYYYYGPGWGWYGWGWRYRGW